ncbi:Uncharacterised protein [Vibrio cholerae]|nr:Uncharacterised protein [Vibrio cholerae]
MVGKDSVIGTEVGSPYTVADELNTSDFTPASRIAATKTKVPFTLLS